MRPSSPVVAGRRVSPWLRSPAWASLGVVLLAALAARAAHAEPEPVAQPPALKVTHEPPPRHLRMRPRAAAVAPPPPSRPAIPMPAAPPRLSELDARDRDELAALRDVLAPVSFSITVGYQVDGARPSGRSSLDAPLQAGRDYNALRAYGFGELFFSTRGVAIDSLSSYIALRLDATAPPDAFRSPGQPATRNPSHSNASPSRCGSCSSRTGWCCLTTRE